MQPERTASPAWDGRPRLLRRRAPRPRRKLSEVLSDIAGDERRERVSVRDLVRAMEGRAFGALLLIFAVPNALPAIPGTSGILGLPLLFLSFQMMLGRAPWLPNLIADRSVARSDFARLVGRVNPWLDWADRFTAPRLSWLADGPAQRPVGLFCLLMSVILVLPIPLGNMLPGLAICMIAIGVLERDGLWVLGGVGVGIVAEIVALAVVWAFVTAAWLFVVQTFFA